MYDYLSLLAPDNNVTLATPCPQKVLVEHGLRNQVVHLADDDSEERIGFSTGTIFDVTLIWRALSESDAGTILDFYFDTAKGDARLKSFKWAHPTDTHTYVVRFNSDLTRTIAPAANNIHALPSMGLKVLGYA